VTSPGGGDRTHLKRIYARIDDLNARVSRLERSVYLGTGGVGVLAIINLVTNLTQGGGTGG
jgi:hypothetical protein